MKQYPQSFVANVDTSEKPGTHWVAFYFIDDQHGEFFDSYELPPHRYTKYFEDFLNRNAAQWTYNDALVPHFVKRKLVVREIVKPSNSCKPFR